MFEQPQNLPASPGLVDPMLRPDGSRVNDAEEWPVQRAYLIDMLRYYLYGHCPELPTDLECSIESETPVYGGRGIRSLYRLSVERHGRRACLRVGLLAPEGDGPFPLIIKNDVYRFDMMEVDDPKRRTKFVAGESIRSIQTATGGQSESGPGLIRS